MKYISDIDGLAIEWEWADGGRWWESFDSQEELDEALRRYDEYVAANHDEYLTDKKRSVLADIELNLEMIDDDCGYLLTDWQIKVAENYRKYLLRKNSRKSEGYPLVELLNVIPAELYLRVA